MNNFELTLSQQSAIQTFEDFLKSDSQVFMLKGAAGTGKTTLVTEFLKILKAQQRTFHLMAPTGRAAHIVGNKTGEKAFTIHKSIYQINSVNSISKNKEDEDDGGLHAKFGLRNNNDGLNTVYLVDESSLVSDAYSESEAFFFGTGQLLTDLFTFCNNRKIVFIGDYAQLPPINMNFSPALDKEYLEQKFGCKVIEFVLRNVIRQQSDSLILDNANRIRDCIESKTFVEFKLQNGADTNSSNDDLLEPYFALSEQKPNPRSMVITYSNQQALLYNIAVRNHYWGESAPRLIEGDLLMIARNNYAYDYELFNGNIVRVDACAPDEEIESRYISIKVKGGLTETVELRFRKAVLKFQSGNEVVDISVKILDNFLDDPNGALGGLVARALVVDFEKRLPIYIKEQLSQIKRSLHRNECLSAEQQRIYEEYLKMLLHDPYYNAVICKYGYATTCHKAQGGEWDNVFVDMSRYGGTANENYFRWAYTALTRASKQIWHYRSPDFNYISNIVVEPIQHSKDIKISTYSKDADFCASRFARIEALCRNTGITVTDDKPHNYQHWINFTNGNDNYAKFCLWYNAIGYSNKVEQKEYTSEGLANVGKTIIENSYVPDDVPYTNKERPFAEKLTEYLRTIFDELDITLLDITQEQYQDVFHLKTDGFAKLIFTYAKKGNYTYLKLISSIGEEDKKLEALRQRFI